MKSSSTFKIGIVALLGSCIFHGCRPASPQWEYRTQAVALSKKDAALKANGDQGWELVSAQDSRTGSDIEIKKMREQKESLTSQIVENFDLAAKVALNEPKTRLMLQTFAKGFADVGDDIPLNKEAKKLALEIEKGIRTNKQSPLGSVQKTLIPQLLREIATLSEKKVEVIQAIEVAQSTNCKLVFKRQKT